MYKELFYKQKVFLVLTPPSITDISAYSTQKLFSVIHNIGTQQSFLDKLFGIKGTFSFEIVSSREEGIRYVIGAPLNYIKSIERTILSYLPQIIIKQADDYLPMDISRSEIIELNLKRHFAFPLAKQTSLEEHDPVAYITGMMTKLNPDELIDLQIVLSPANSAITKKIVQLLMHTEDVITYLQNEEFPWLMKFLGILFSQVIQGVSFIMSGITSVLTELIHGPSYTSYQEQMKFTDQKPIRILTPYEKEIVRSIQDKINQPLFEASIRLLVSVEDKIKGKERIKGIQSSLAPFSIFPYQSLTASLTLPFLAGWRQFFFRKRILPVNNNTSRSIFSVTEIADLYHFPYTKITKTEDLVKAKEKILSAPLSLKQKYVDHSVVLGKNIFSGTETKVGLQEKQRSAHMYMIGGSGMGKTTMLKSMIYQDIVKGKGLCLLDPHGDLTKDILSLIPSERQKDVVYINPLDEQFAVGLNILSPLGISLSSQEQQERINSAVIAIFKKLTDKEYWGPRLEHILRNAVLTSYQTDAPTLIPTLYTVQLLLTDKAYRRDISKKLTDPVLKRFWEKEFSLYGSMQLANVISPVTNKLGKFITNKLTRRILLQQETTIDIARIMDEGKILLVNLSKGDLGEDRSFFFGSLITSLIQIAAYQRTSLPEEKRNDFYLYIDEFQNFATSSFAEIVSEARKYHIYTILSHQNTAQIENKDLLKVILGNVGTLVSFRTSPDDEAVVLPFFAPEVKKGDLINLKPHQCVIKIRNEQLEDSFTAETIMLSEKGSSETMEMIINESRERYAKPQAKVEEELQQVFAEDVKSPIVSSSISKPKKTAKKIKL